MSQIGIYSTEQNREHYTQYLEDQLEKLSTFMLYQKKQNQKYNQLTQIIEDQNQKIKLINDKVLLLELYQNQNLKAQQKLSTEFHKANSLEKRVNCLQMYALTPENSHSERNRKYKEENQRQMMEEVEDKIEVVRRQFNEQMAHMEHKLTKKLVFLTKDFEKNSGNNNVKVKKAKNETSNDMSPLETNYSQNNKSRINQIDRHIPITQREINQNHQKISAFSNQSKHSALQRPSADTYRNKAPSIHTQFKETSIYNHQQRSPISQYLKKQKQYSSDSHSLLKSNSIVTKKFYSEVQANLTKKQKIKHKKSKSRSRSKSQKSVSKSNNSKSIGHNKKKEKKPKSAKNEINESKVSRMSQKSISQISQKSRSRSKSSSKISKKQNKYLMLCQKMH